MKVYLSKYKDNWLSPYTILEKVFFWREIDYDEPVIDKWSDRLQPLCNALYWIRKKINPRVTYVKIDCWDTWSADHTLALIILPLLKQLVENNHGAPYVDDEDVPEELKSTSAPLKENEYDTDANHFKRWDYVLNEMIFAFTCKVDDTWQDDFRSGEIDMVWVKTGETFFNPVTNKEEELSQMEKGPNDTYKCDYEGMRIVEERIQNGFRLFGKYYQSLWT